MVNESEITTNLAAGIVGGKTLREWWETAPHGAFHKKCAELGIKLEFGSKPEKLNTYTVTLRYEYSGYGRQTVTVEAEDEDAAEKMALRQFDESEVDFDNAQIDIDDVKVEGIEAQG